MNRPLNASKPEEEPRNQRKPGTFDSGQFLEPWVSGSPPTSQVLESGVGKSESAESDPSESHAKSEKQKKKTYSEPDTVPR